MQKFKHIFTYLLYIFLLIFFVILCLNMFGFSFGVVVSNSMVPSLSKNDLVLINPHKKARASDIIAFKMDKVGLVIHRVLRVINKDGKTIYLCAGDNNSFYVEIDEKQVDISDINKRISYLESLSIDEAISHAENVVYSANVVGTACVNFKNVGLLVQVIFNNKLVVIILLVVSLIILNKNSNKYRKNTYL